MVDVLETFTKQSISMMKNVSENLQAPENVPISTSYEFLVSIKIISGSLMKPFQSPGSI